MLCVVCHVDDGMV